MKATLPDLYDEHDIVQRAIHMQGAPKQQAPNR